MNAHESLGGDEGPALRDCGHERDRGHNPPVDGPTVVVDVEAFAADAAFRALGVDRCLLLESVAGARHAVRTAEEILRAAETRLRLGRERTVREAVDFRQNQLQGKLSNWLLLPTALVCHSRFQRFDKASPALRICMETARARLALAGRRRKPEPES